MCHWEKKQIKHSHNNSKIRWKSNSITITSGTKNMYKTCIWMQRFSGNHNKTVKYQTSPVLISYHFSTVHLVSLYFWLFKRCNEAPLRERIAVMMGVGSTAHIYTAKENVYSQSWVTRPPPTFNQRMSLINPHFAWTLKAEWCHL